MFQAASETKAEEPDKVSRYSLNGSVRLKVKGRYNKMKTMTCRRIPLKKTFRGLFFNHKTRKTGRIQRAVCLERMARVKKTWE